MLEIKSKSMKQARNLNLLRKCDLKSKNAVMSNQIFRNLI